MVLVYATASDYTAYTGQSAPSGVDQELARASERIDELLLGAVYPTDEDGRPVEDDVREALMRATCAQAAWQVTVGDPYGVASAFKSVSIGSVKLDREASTSTGAQRYAQDALSILRTAGLLPGSIIDASA
ncbi:hypothetical protein [Spongiactinospora sp. TRM90649]|uniref:hypothetical protein n=1 Tax=Spongiactinospora sp. TRM90649 TaxID=3031114 RepID=UPI0023F92BD5|nr:hypothetical protein [Spongiactinospora sp. TRM90649]MDF5756656.1 hypothetical protein [Spongiactinospora sp. TRM90649]